MDNLNKARNLLESGNYTCVVCKEDTVYTTSQRGVAPLLNWLEEGTDLRGFSAADRVVGRGAAFLYCLLGVREVYARVMSRPAAEVLHSYGIPAEADTFVEGIINCDRSGLLYTSIPQNGNWSARVDGQEVPITLIGDAMVGVHLTEGSHTVSFRYHNPAFSLGWKVSLACMAVFALLVQAVYKPDWKLLLKVQKHHGRFEK